MVSRQGWPESLQYPAAIHFSDLPVPTKQVSGWLHFYIAPMPMAILFSCSIQTKGNFLKAAAPQYAPYANISEFPAPIPRPAEYDNRTRCLSIPGLLIAGAFH